MSAHQHTTRSSPDRVIWSVISENERKLNIEQLAIILAAVSVVTGLTATLFAFRADAASRGARQEAARRWDDMVRPRPHFTFVGGAATGQPIEVEVENLGGTLAAGAVVAAYGDQLFATELTLPDKAPPRRIMLPFVVKAWQPARQPTFLLVAGRDVSGRWWDCLDGMKVIKDPRRWIDSHLKEMRLQGAVSFPELSGSPNTKR
jgi:hypothetical protein